MFPLSKLQEPTYRDSPDSNMMKLLLGGVDYDEKRMSGGRGPKRLKAQKLEARAQKMTAYAQEQAGRLKKAYENSSLKACLMQCSQCM